ncbi:MAG: type II toxin-antitoxin system HipA family toxin [Pseudomonadota bacterium]
MNSLVCLLDDREVGRVVRARGRLTFTYADSWLRTPGAYPLSLSMPLAAGKQGHSAIEPFLWGLLPDNALVLRRWAQMFHVSPQNLFGLVAAVGEDCAGAVQFMTPERFDALQREEAPRVSWLSEEEVAARLRVLRQDGSAGRTTADLGQFSLAGAQPKTALLFDGQRWGIPAGRTPTTHILKPTTAEFDGHAENEHICMALARSLGLPTATTQVLTFEEVTAIAVERYDRVDTRQLAASAAARTAAAADAAAAQDAAVMAQFSRKTPFYRVHQEDLCQALGLHPSKKYQNEGGPSPQAIVSLLRSTIAGQAAQADVTTFIRFLAFNWIVGGTDAHSKNVSLLLGSDGVVRLAPFYDIASIYAYPHIDPRKAKLAMKIGDTYRIDDVSWRKWAALAKDLRLPADQVIDEVREMARGLPAALAEEVRIARTKGLEHPVLDRLSHQLVERAAHVSASLGRHRAND